MEDVKNVKIVGEENYTGSDNLTWKQIILQQYKKVLSLSCVQWQPSRIDSTPVSINGMVYYQKQHLPDTRKIFINSTKSFAYALIGHFDDGMKKAFKAYEKSIKDLQGDCEKQEKDKVKHDINEYFNWKELSITLELFKELSHFLVRIDVAVLDESEKLEE